MPDKEKVIKGLEKLREYADSEVHPILSPDNWSIYSELRDLIDETENDILALLNAQGPRVMTLEEARNAEVVWAEDRSTRAIYPYIVKNDMNDSKLYKYGVQWRCWTSRPTEEQREAVAWE